jgi:CRP-like cAMP-binding protein
MIIQQTDLFHGLSNDFIKAIMDITLHETRGEGDMIFHEGDKAEYFYFLLKGRVKLTTGKTHYMVHTVNRGGEIFGWSSLVGRDVYSASAECLASTKLLKFTQEEFQKIVENEPINGMIFFKNLAGAIGERLINSYISSVFAQPSEALTYGSSTTLQQRGEEDRSTSY